MARFLAALDSCVFIEAARVPDGLCNAILTFAETGRFDVLVAPQVVSELAANLTADAEIERLQRWRSLWIVCDGATRQQLDEETHRLLALMRHAADVPIAIAIRHSPLRPHVLVTSNYKHWSKIGAAIGTEIMTPMQFIKALRMELPD